MILWLIGYWLLGDGLISIYVHMKDKRQSWEHDHSVRLIRALLGLVLLCLSRKGLKQI